VRKVLHRLWPPTFLFLLCLSLGLVSRRFFTEAETDAATLLHKLVNHPWLIGLWLTGAWLIVRLIDVFFWDRLVAATLGRPVPRLLKDLIVFAVFAVASACIIAFVFELPITGFWATSGVVGIVLGFALRNVILDLFTGLAINLDHSLRIGDWVEIRHRDFGGPVYGRVLQINWRTIRIELENRNTVVVPNGFMAVMPFTNFSQPDDLSRFEVFFTLDFAVPAERAIRILLAGAKAAVGPKGPVEDPEPQVLVDEATETGVKYRVRYFLRVSAVSPGVGRHAVTRSILEQLSRADLTPARRNEDVYYAPLPQHRPAVQFEGDCKDLLAQADLFHESLHAPELDELAKVMLPRHYKAGDVLLHQGDGGESLFILAEGLLNVYVDQGKEHGRLKVAQITPGETFGEMSLLTGELRSATVTAATDIVAFEIVKEHVQELIGRRREIAERMTALVAERRLRSIKALEDAPHEQRHMEKHNIYTQIMDKMKHFFGWGSPCDD
jgi:small-conductance mechanosensitive channel/CRP-like cAMP-binding protein